MEQVTGLTVVMGMFVLRVAMPVAITLAVCYVLHCFEARWQRADKG